MRTAVFVAPYLMEATLRFVDAAAAIEGVRLGLITQEPEDRVPSGLRARLAGHYRVGDALDAQQIADAVRAFAGHLGAVDRVIGSLEQLQVPLGEVRDALGIPGMGAEAANNVRDKARMKTVLRAAGVPCARHALAGDPDAARRFIAQAGLPAVVKPPAGSGARGTFRVESLEHLEQWLQADPPTPANPALVEEMVTGVEHSFESVMLHGTMVWHSISRYLPSPLEVLENPWIQWAVLLPRDIDGAEYDGIRAAAGAGLRALGVDTGLSHMEWFHTKGGGVAISEVGARPPGAQFTSLLSFAHDRDFYVEWARVAILEEFEPPERRWAVGAAYLRGQGRGRVEAVLGLDELQAELGALVVEARLPQRGQPLSDSYEGEGHVIIRHQDTAVVEEALHRIVSVAQVQLSDSPPRVS